MFQTCQFHAEAWHISYTYHEWYAKCSVSSRADTVCHFAVHPAHDVHVHCAALETRAEDQRMKFSVSMACIHSYSSNSSEKHVCSVTPWTAGGVLTSRAMLSWRPNTRFSSFPLNQLTAYVFWATAKDSPPILPRKIKNREMDGLS